MDNLKWPNVEKYVVAWLSTRTGRPVFTETTNDLPEFLPAYQVARVGGSQSSELTKVFEVEVDSIAGTRAGVWAAVATLETAMAALASNGTQAWYVDDVTETFSSAIQSTGNSGARRASATYGLTVRPR